MSVLLALLSWIACQAVVTFVLGVLVVWSEGPWGGWTLRERVTMLWREDPNALWLAVVGFIWPAGLIAIPMLALIMWIGNRYDTR